MAFGLFTSERNPDMTDLNYQEEVVCYVMDSGISYLRKKYVRQILLDGEGYALMQPLCVAAQR